MLFSVGQAYMYDEIMWCNDMNYIVFNNYNHGSILTDLLNFQPCKHVIFMTT